MKEIAYHYKVRVKTPDGKLTTEHYTVNEVDSKMGSALATAKVCSFYETLKEKKTILEYRLLV